jgi:hypothetical protein
MATTTPNFGWPVPTSTDLVKDGATAIEALGDGIDTSMVDLKGGLTGQVLAKTTNADMDFTWVTTDDANAIQNSIVDAKGDLISATANDTPARLAVGNNGETLVADSSTSTGLRYQGSAIGKNAAINGACEIAQRGTAAVTLTAASFQYPVDRFFAFRSAGTTGATAQQFTSTSLDGFQYALRVQRTAANTSTNDIGIGQSFETSNSIPFANKTVVVSFWARAGANYSPTSGGLSVRFYTGTGTDQSGFGSSFTGTATPISQTATLTTSWQRFQYTATLASTTTQVQFLTFATPTGTAGAADYYDITGLQVELGAIATPFSRSQGTIQGELSACQRYYWRVAPYSISGGSGGSAYARFGSARVISSTVTSTVLPFPVPMRTSPTSIEGSGTASNYAVVAGSVIACSAVPAYDSSTQYQATFTFTVASGLTAGQAVEVGVNNGAAAYLGFSAEL